MSIKAAWEAARPVRTKESIDADYREVMRTTRQRWWQIWKPHPNAIERAIIDVYQAESRHTCLYTGPEDAPPK
jgi:hypothetical protein